MHPCATRQQHQRCLIVEEWRQIDMPETQKCGQRHRYPELWMAQPDKP